MPYSLTDEQIAQLAQRFPGIDQVIGQTLGAIPPEAPSLTGATADLINKQAALGAVAPTKILQNELAKDRMAAEVEIAMEKKRQERSLQLLNGREAASLGAKGMQIIRENPTLIRFDQNDELAGIVTQLASLKEDGKFALDLLKKPIDDRLFAAASQNVEEEANTRRVLNEPPLSPEDHAKRIEFFKTRLERGEVLDPKLEAASFAKEVERQRAERTKLDDLTARTYRAVGQKPPKPTVESIVKQAQHMEPANQEAYLKRVGEEHGAKGGGKGTLLGGALGGAVGALLLSKIFGGSGEEKTLPPEQQMMLLQQLRGGAPARGGEGESEDRDTGRSLLNMTRALGLVQAMQRMAGMQQAAQTPTVAQLV